MSTNEFRRLKVTELQPDTGYQRPYYFSVNPVKVTSSGLDVMTDLKFLPAATVPGTASVVHAENMMIARGVRLLLIVDANDHVVGLITVRDLKGQQILSLLESRDLGADQLAVSEVMTPAAAIEVLEFEDVLHSHVGDIIETLRGSGRQHALVVDHEPIDNRQKIRGIFSASQIARQLGIVTTGNFDPAGTFAELDALLKKPSA